MQEASFQSQLTCSVHTLLFLATLHGEIYEQARFTRFPTVPELCLSPYFLRTIVTQLTALFTRAYIHGNVHSDTKRFLCSASSGLQPRGSAAAIQVGKVLIGNCISLYVKDLVQVPDTYRHSLS